MKGQIGYVYDDKGKLFPVIGSDKEKSDIIKGIEMKIVNQSDNFLTFTLELPNNYKGNFDIVVYDEVDYDTFYNAEGFYLKATK